MSCPRNLSSFWPSLSLKGNPDLGLVLFWYLSKVHGSSTHISVNYAHSSHFSCLLLINEILLICCCFVFSPLSHFFLSLKTEDNLQKPGWASFCFPFLLCNPEMFLFPPNALWAFCKNLAMAPDHYWKGECCPLFLLGPLASLWDLSAHERHQQKSLGKAFWSLRHSHFCLQCLRVPVCRAGCCKHW